MSSPAAPSEYKSGLSAKQANQMYWLTGLAPVATNLVTPLMVFWRMRSLDKSLMVKYNQQVNEVGRQFISGSIGLLAYFGGGELTRGLLKQVGWNRSPSGGHSESNQQVGMMLGGTLMNFLGYAIVRPMISTPFICKFLKKEGQEQSLTPAQVDQLMQAAHAQGKTLVAPAQRLAFWEAEMLKLGEDKTKPPKVDGFPIRQMQNWIDAHLFEEVGKPLLGKTAGVATVALASWFTLLASSLYLLNRTLGKPKTSPSERSAILPLKPLPLSPVSYPPSPRVTGAPVTPVSTVGPSSLYPYGF